MSKKDSTTEVSDTAVDTTTNEQRQYYYALHNMIAEAERPMTATEMTETLRALRRQANRQAKHLQVPFNEWWDEVARRLYALMEATCLPIPKKASNFK